MSKLTLGKIKNDIINIVNNGVGEQWCQQSFDNIGYEIGNYLYYNGLCDEYINPVILNITVSIDYSDLNTRMLLFKVLL
jgi:hypothetical protein